MTRNILVLVLFLSAISVVSAQALPGSRIRLNPERLKFTYWNNDGDVNLTCTHKLVNELSQDWEVECSDGAKLKKSYGVHLWATVYLRNRKPEQTTEILYWVTDKTQPTNLKNTGTSFWLNSTNASPFHSLTMSQAVDNDTASLYLDIKPENTP